LILLDLLSVQIADFSEAEQDGFTAAFVKFWQKHPDNDRSESQLKEAAKKLIKGCTYHFKGCVVNVSRCSGVVSVDRKNEFILKVFNLITIPEIDDLTREVAEILQQFPKAASFLKWWLRPKIAPRIFSALRDMPEDRWIRLPDTTNAEEAQHFKLYSALGKNHSLISGLEALLYFATYYFSLWLDSFSKCYSFNQ
jgi:hypothetical protein